MERMKGFEPSTFCMASRRSSQLSYIRPVPRGWWIIDQAPPSCKQGRGSTATRASPVLLA